MSEVSEPDDREEVLAVFTERIEQWFGLHMDRLQAAVTVGPNADPEVTAVVRGYKRLSESQLVLERAEDALATALEASMRGENVPKEEFVAHARRLNEAEVERDMRAIVVLGLLEEASPERYARGRAERQQARHEPAIAPPTSSLTNRSRRR